MTDAAGTDATAESTARPATVVTPKPTKPDPNAAREAKRQARAAKLQAQEAERTAQAQARREAKAAARGSATAATTTAGATAAAGAALGASSAVGDDTVTLPLAAPISPPPKPARRAGTTSATGVPAGMVRRGRRVQRVVRRIDLWSVLKLSLVLYTCLYVAVLIALAGLWALAYSTGQIGNLQSFLGDVGMKNYRFYGDQMFRACAAIGGVGVLAGTLITVLTAGIINAISEITGGIRFVIIEEDVGPRA